MLRLKSIIICLFIVFQLFANSERKTAFITRTEKSPVIDGKCDDEAWKSTNIISDFFQFAPIFGKEASFKTEVRLLYNDYAIFVCAVMYDPKPDSIFREIGYRDDDNLNSDMFYFQFDTYNNQLDAYTFSLTASGVQSENRENDYSYNAVWESKTSINENGWIAEIKIPYSEIRFPNKPVQTWGIQFIRHIRRLRENDLWAKEQIDADNNLINWGILNGLENIDPPLRLSFNPYLSAQLEHFPYNIEGESNYSTLYSGGIDVKYGIDESFTLDMTLLPDFSQVKSDNEIKNLSAFETVYSEQRPFFQEAIDLFQKGGLFYSRRIGRKPLLFFDVEDNLADGEQILDNPTQAKLLNATKISGRGKSGLALGIFNAMTDNTYATIKDSLGNKKTMLTDPMTNYSIVVCDQDLKNNSSAYIINTNTLRKGNFQNSNVTGAGINLVNKSNSYKLSLSGSLSRIFAKQTDNHNFENDIGLQYNISLSKIKGNFKFTLESSIMDNHFNANDLGLTLRNNYINNQIFLNYNFYLPFWHFRELYNTFSFTQERNYSTGKIILPKFYVNSFGTFKNYLSVWQGFEYVYDKRYDYYEPRVNGKYYLSTGYVAYFGGFSSDYRKTLAVDIEYVYAYDKTYNNNYVSASLSPIFRIGNRTKLTYTTYYELSTHDVGFADIDDSDNIIFGMRKIATITNALSGRYMFSNYLYLSLIARHYWSQGEYREYYYLQDNGTISSKINYSGNSNFNFNSFNIDLSLFWEFSPGSQLSLVWKNAIITEDEEIIHSFSENFSNTMQSSQLNSVLLKLKYYLDYNYIKHTFSRKSKQV